MNNNVYLQNRHINITLHFKRLEVDRFREEVACVRVDPHRGPREPRAGPPHRAHLQAVEIISRSLTSIINCPLQHFIICDIKSNLHMFRVSEPCLSEVVDGGRRAAQVRSARDLVTETWSKS